MDTDAGYFKSEEQARLAAFTQSLRESGDLDAYIDDRDLGGFVAYAVDYESDALSSNLSADDLDSMATNFQDRNIGQYEGGIAEYASQLIDDMGGVKEAMGDRVSSYIDYEKWEEELDSVDEGYGYRKVGDGYEVYDRQDEDVEPTFYNFETDAKRNKELMNADVLDDLIAADASHPGGETYVDRYADVRQWARDLELGGDIVDLGDGHLIWGH